MNNTDLIEKEVAELDEEISVCCGKAFERGKNAAKERILELEAALKPFADEAEATSIRAEFYDIVNCYAGHLRAARAALEKKE